jgi:type IV secretory pathway VirB10-like protein
MTSTLPSRWQEILRREAAANVGTVLAQAREQPGPRRVPRWTVPALVVGLASVSLLTVLGGTEVKGKGTVPFDRSTVISTRTAGLGASAEDLAPRTTPTLAPAPTPEPTTERLELEPRRPIRRAKPEANCPECDRRRAALAASASPWAAEPTPEPSPSPTPKPAPMVINIGTRVEALLTEPVVTGAALAPATAQLVNDVMVGDQIAIPAGTLLVGEGFATQQDDRAQVVFSAIVKDGKTVQFEGWALQQGEVGVKGKVIKKGSKGKGGAGTLLGAAATGLSFGLSGAVPGAGGAALSSLGNSAASDLIGLGRDWRRTDKVVRVEKGVPITVYIRRDLAIE